jgi:hypothetical protein
MKIVGNYIFSLCLLLLANQALSANYFSGHYEGKIKSILGYSNRACQVKVEKGLSNSYLVTFNGGEIASSLYVDEESSSAINNSLINKMSEKIKVVEGSRLNEGIGYKEAKLTFQNGVLASVYFREEYLVFLGRKKEICGLLKKISN